MLKRLRNISSLIILIIFVIFMFGSNIINAKENEDDRELLLFDKEYDIYSLADGSGTTEKGFYFCTDETVLLKISFADEYNRDLDYYGSHDINIYYADSGQLVDRIIGTTKGSEEIVLLGGKFYVDVYINDSYYKVERNGTLWPQYVSTHVKIKLSIEKSGETFPESYYDHYNTTETAKEISISKMYKGAFGNGINNDCEDIYKIELPYDTEYGFFLSLKASTMMDMQPGIFIYDLGYSQYKELYASWDTDSNTWSLKNDNTSLKKGTYYIKIFNSNSSNHDQCKELYVYNFKITTTYPIIVDQPTDSQVVSDATVKFSVRAIGDGLKYQWYESNDGTKWNKSNYTGNNTQTISIVSKGGLNGRLFRCLVSNEYGEIYSKASTITVLAENSKGIFQLTMNGKKEWYYISNGKIQNNDSVEKNENGWWKITKGKVDFNYTGFAKNSNGWWYCEKGKVNFNKKDVIKGTVNGQSGWWCVSGGKVQFTDSVEKNSNGWWCVQKGKVNFNYTGFAKNSNGWWYCEKGKVNFNKKDVIKGTVNGQSGWWYVSGGKVQFVNSVEKNSNGWWCIQNGKVNFNYTGFAKNSNGWWYCEKGKVNFNKKEVIKGTVNGQSGWWYVSGGKVQFTDTVEKNSNGWWSIKNGKVDFSFTGIAKNSNGQWYCKGGKVQFSYSGTITYNGKKYNIKNGKVQ